jgi:hypothetical protein
MPRAADRKKFSDALQNAEKQSLQDVHRLLLSYCGVQTVDVRRHGAILQQRSRSSCKVSPDIS